MIAPTDSLSRDSLFDGELTCFQHKNGYRFSMDAVLIAHFVEIRKNDSILDLGTGSGIIGLILLYRWQKMLGKVTGIEVQPLLAKLARKNFQINYFEQQAKVIEGDIKEINNFIKPESYDKIVCNPPFYTPTSGRTNNNLETQLARHQILATLEDFFTASAFAVKNGGSVFFVYPAEQLCECLVFARKNRLEAKKLQFVYSYPDKIMGARLVLIQCMKNGGAGSEVLPPIYVYREKNGLFTPEMLQFYCKNNKISSNSDH